MGSLISIQYLRAVAALMVLVYHVLGDTFKIGEAGVDIFFVISGFVMWSATARAQKTPLAFWRARLVRVVPLYWLCTFIYIILRFANGDVSPEFRFREIVLSLSFIPFTNSLNHEPVPVLDVGWTLNYEILFYLVFGLCLFTQSKITRVFGMFAVFAALVAIRPLVDQSTAIAFRFTSPLFFEFFAGILLAAFLMSLQRRGGGWSRGTTLGLGIVLTVLSVAAFCALAIKNNEMPRTIKYGVPASALVLGCVFLEPVLARHRLGALKLLGDASYSLYLTHPLTYYVLARIVWQVEHPAPVYLATAFTLAIVFGILVHLYVEKPLLLALRPDRARMRALEGQARPADLNPKPVT